MKEIFEKDGHLTAEALAALGGGTLGADELEAAASHIARCEKCAEALDGCCAGLCRVPAGMTELVRSRAAGSRGADRQLLFFSLRVAAAACAALVIVFTGLPDALADSLRRPPDISSGTHFADSVSSGLRDFSQKITSLEVISNAESKK
jgi:hypothetical protein